MSVPTENNVSTESIRFINSESEHGCVNEFERKKAHSNSAENSESNCSSFDKLIRRMNGLYMWKIPWTIILISVVQVRTNKQIQ